MNAKTVRTAMTSITQILEGLCQGEYARTVRQHGIILDNGLSPLCCVVGNVLELSTLCS